MTVGAVSPELTAGATFALASLVAWLATPVAISVARRTSFFDHPMGYKGHAGPTPYLGGAAVMLAFLVMALAVGAAGGKLGVLLPCAIGLWILGTIDDRVTVRPLWRILAVVTVAAILWAADLGWSVVDIDVLDLLLTTLWVLGLVNACNLMDNLDGATASVAGVSAVGAGVLALMSNQAELASLAFAVSGACIGFLPHNLAGPARIFLGDGGSMPIGFLVASVTMVAAVGDPAGGAALIVGGMIVGLFIFDTTLVVVSRSRQGIPLVTAGRDHVTHRLQAKLKSPRLVALTLACIQGALCAAAVWAAEAQQPWLAILAVGSVTVGLAALALLDSPTWRPTASWVVVAQRHDLAIGPKGRRPGRLKG